MRPVILARVVRGHAHSTRSAGSSQALFLLGLVVGLLAALSIDRVLRYLLDGDIELVRRVRDLASEEYVREVEPSHLIEDALEGMLQQLDEHSTFYGPLEVAALERETTGEFLGIGAVFRGGDPGRVLFPCPGSPAERCGLRVGDRILQADGQAVAEMALEELHGLLRSATKEVELEVESLEGSVRRVQVRPEPVLDPTVRHARVLREPPGIGYLAIRSFSHRTPSEFDSAVDRLRQQNLRGLILDLRGNPGGILDSAIAIANRFIERGTIVATRMRSEVRTIEADDSAATFRDLPLVLLVDGATASAGEVLAAALQDHSLAALVGEPTYGKGTVQTLRRVGPERAVVKLTTAHYCSPSLRRIEHADDDSTSSGIAPDLFVPLTREERARAHEFLAGYSPPEEALAALVAWEEQAGSVLLVDLPEDPQVRTALALLCGEPIELHGPAE
jgi:carboxyl-terminal processing protease